MLLLWIICVICVLCSSCFLLCSLLPCGFVTFPCGILGQVWYLIVSIPDLCCLSYFEHFFMSQLHFTVCRLINISSAACSFNFDWYTVNLLLLHLSNYNSSLHMYKQSGKRIHQKYREPTILENTRLCSIESQLLTHFLE